MKTVFNGLKKDTLLVENTLLGKVTKINLRLVVG